MWGVLPQCRFAGAKRHAFHACPTTTICNGIVRLQPFDAWVRDSGGHISGHQVFVAGGMGNGVVTLWVPLVAQQGSQ